MRERGNKIEREKERDRSQRGVAAVTTLSNKLGLKALPIIKGQLMCGLWSTTEVTYYVHIYTSTTRHIHSFESTNTKDQ